MYSIYIKGAHGKVDINNPHRVAYGQDKDGYYRVVLSNNKTRKYIKIHQIMAEQFLGKTPEGFVVNHIDGDKHNNNVDNLEIITAIENINHAWKMGLSDKNKNPNRVKVDVYDHKEDNFYHMDSIEDTKRLTNLKWTYINRIRTNEAPWFHECKFVKVIDGYGIKNYHIDCYYNGMIFKTFKSVTEAGAYFGKPGNSVSGAFKSKYSEKTNRFTLTFPNVSTIESIAS